jgi:[ribosomal protein S5]-alanine N-acetyltransferase
MLSEGDVVIRPVGMDDAEVIARYANNAKIAVNLRDGFPHPYTLRHAKDFVSKMAMKEPPMIFAIEYNGEFCGVIGLSGQDDVYRMTSEIGYWIAEPFWGKGIATEAVRLLTDYGLNELGFVRIHTGVFEYNPASMKVLEKNGYALDGIFRKSVFKQGRIWDEHRYSIIRE